MTTDQKSLLEKIKLLAVEVAEARRSAEGKVSEETLEDVEFVQERVELLAESLETKFLVTT